MIFPDKGKQPVDGRFKARFGESCLDGCPPGAIFARGNFQRHLFQDAFMEEMLEYLRIKKVCKTVWVEFVETGQAQSQDF